MNYLYLLFIPAVAFGRDTRPSYLVANYYNEHPVHITLTYQPRDMGDIVSFVQDSVDRYMRFNETDSTGQEHISFNLLPLTEYQPIEVKHAEAGYISSDIYKTTYYISHFNKLETRWVWNDHTYNFVRFSCYITTHRTLSCTAAYNKPWSQEFITLVDVLCIFMFISVIVANFVFCKRQCRNRRQLEARSTNSTNELRERLNQRISDVTIL